MTINKIELISTKILNQNRKLADELISMNNDLGLSGGWHYILDWIWALGQIESSAGKVFIDAGAGIGLLQWYLANQGAHIISVDRSDRTCIPFHLVKKFNVDGLTGEDKPLNTLQLFNIFNGRAKISARIKAILRGVLGKLRYGNHIPVTGKVTLYRRDLSMLTDITDDSIDSVVSISALEHNESIGNVKKIISELLRVLKPGGKMIITLPASYQTDWFFEPAYSWCFTDVTIKDIFELPKDTKSNYDQYTTQYNELKNSQELKTNLSWWYFISRNNGMPFGKWDPQYLPVGVVKTKHKISK
jgi:SAM-dependent methyltransferase